MSMDSLIDRTLFCDELGILRGHGFHVLHARALVVDMDLRRSVFLEKE